MRIARQCQFIRGNQWAQCAAAHYGKRFYAVLMFEGNPRRCEAATYWPAFQEAQSAAHEETQETPSRLHLFREIDTS